MLEELKLFGEGLVAYYGMILILYAGYIGISVIQELYTRKEQRRRHGNSH
jgi:hypothetical protein